METNIKDSGIWICSTAKEKRSGQMEVSIREIIHTVKKMDTVSIDGRMGACTSGTGSRTPLMEQEHTSGLTGQLIQGIGKIMKCMGKDFIRGKMGELTEGVMWMGRKRDLACTHGQTGRCFKANGEMGSSMGRARLLFRMDNR